MGRKKGDGLGRFGGRAKGTPNKSTSAVREWILSFINGRRKQIERDFDALTPKDRLLFIEKLLPYVVAKKNAITMDGDFNSLDDESLFGLAYKMTCCVTNDNGNPLSMQEAPEFIKQLEKKY